MVAGVAMGIGAMSAVVLRLPFTAVLLATLLTFSDGLAVTPLVIVAVVVAYVIGLRLAPSWPLPGSPQPGGERTTGSTPQPAAVSAPAVRAARDGATASE
jgi:hypothetical protein